MQASAGAQCTSSEASEKVFDLCVSSVLEMDQREAETGTGAF